jgi:hypothetical protein
MTRGNNYVQNYADEIIHVKWTHGLTMKMINIQYTYIVGKYIIYLYEP